VRSQQLSFFSGPKRRKKMPPALELRTHIAVADTIRAGIQPGWWWSHIGHGGKRNPKTGALLKRMGLRPGLLDFLFIDPAGQHYWLELKRHPNVLTDGQTDFIAEMERRGVPTAVVWTYDEAIGQLTAWGAISVRVAA
jgi:hypothetical protein